jgi:hypothetical protein
VVQVLKNSCATQAAILLETLKLLTFEFCYQRKFINKKKSQILHVKLFWGGGMYL